MKTTCKQASLLCGLWLSLSWPFHTEPAQAASVIQAKVVATSLNVRSEPAPNASVVATVPQGAVVTITDEAYGWAKIRYNQKVGWVAGYYLQKGAVTSAGSASSPANTAVAKSQQGTVLADSLRMRKGPSTSHEIVLSLPRGTRVDILKKQGDWIQARTSNGQTGWVSATYIGDAKVNANAPVTKSTKSPGLKGKVIVIDPGHGGSDVGTQGTKWNSMEKTLNYKTATLLASKLRQRGAQVFMTRTSDTEKPSLAQRVAFSESKGADAFISIHYNSSVKPNSGTLTFYYSQGKDEPLARAIESRLAGGIGLRSNGISFGNYHVLRENNDPSVLIELGFLSNPKDEGIVRTSSYQDKAAQAITEALADYFGR
ncbi:putative N-acetylmuramoyl-L-alanine amidase [Brevibacillus brevis NBRC 100599]|uniref:Putative N-acetylmuramoyl-L-alanine amidase n=1 Tax=Brevibacillus brevis (strain 47 / JCM 6285 / NBRC 100599) TaxID=358681 RepID=C0ZGK0_BREBN|nr:N-acetylmuramoyl-L-alanine amidase [Brevibacillus brevis]BAH44909.1 putative N-acetylmuramoyl-L-alanine amidase [Brevibacillus brevis NBRC 100599]